MLSLLPKAPLARISELLLPAICLLCRNLVAGENGLCAECWKQVEFISPPLCVQCGAPFDIPAIGEGKCGECLRQPPAYIQARAALKYTEASKGMVLRFKHSDQTFVAPTLAAWMRQAAPELLQNAEIITPIPLHWRRLFSRKYNQAALLARHLAKQSQAEFLPQLLYRKRATLSQGRFGRLSRARNVQGAFGLREKDRAKIQGKRVLLIDDVLTTGATVNTAARVLKEAGAARADVLTLARVCLD